MHCEQFKMANNHVLSDALWSDMRTLWMIHTEYIVDQYVEYIMLVVLPKVS